MQAFLAITLAAAAILSTTTVVACGSADTTQQLTIAAASDLRPVLDPIANQFQADTGVAVSISYGSSGQLAVQIGQGAPIDLFFSADLPTAKSAAATLDGVEPPLTTYALGRLALWASGTAGEGVSVADLADPRFTRIAIANPEHAPYGRAARDAIEAAGIQDKVTDRLVLGENVADTLRLASSGNAEVAIVALSLAQTAGGSFTEVPTDLFTPLEQTAVVIATGPAEQRWATELLARFTNAAGRAALADAGFGLPD